MAATIKAKRPRRRPWLLLATLIVLGVIAVQSGWAGFGVAHLWAAVYPKDEGLLSWVPGNVAAVVIVDPHLIEQKMLGSEASLVRRTIARTREDLKRATGIDIAFDVDKMILSPSLVVARGRFDRAALEQRLAAHRYARKEHKGEVFLARANEDAIGIVSGGVLLYGDETSLTAAIDAHASGASLEKDEEITKRLSAVGWNHTVLATVRLNDDKPSIHQIIAGSTGPRAVTVGIRTQAGLDVEVLVDAGTGGSAGEIVTLLEEKRAHLGKALPVADPNAATILEDVAKKATIKADNEKAVVQIHGHIDPAGLDVLGKSASSAGAQFAEYYKTFRLFQLLAPMP